VSPSLPFRPSREATLRALVDTWVPSLAPPQEADERVRDFWAQRASDLGTDVALSELLADRLTPQEQAGIEELIDVLRTAGLARLPVRGRELLLAALSRANAEAGEGIGALQRIALMLFYGSPGNPAWLALGYPGPPDYDSIPVAPPRLETVDVDAVSTAGAPEEWSAEVVVVGSGAGGGVIAATVSEAGLGTVVLEAGDQPDLAGTQALELEAYRSLYWRGGNVATSDGNVSVLAGATLGGGTTVNWSNAVRTPDWVREEWEREAGLAGLAGREFDEHLDAVSERISVTDQLSDENGPNARLREAAQALGMSWRRARRNARADSYDVATAGHMGWGDRSGSKQGTVQTYLRDAVTACARVVTRARVERVLVEGGRAVGVTATVTRPDGSTVPLTVRSPRVVLAAGALETPAVLLRSGIGGPAAGRNLRLHPCVVLPGSYAEPQRPFEGAPHTVIVDEYLSPEHPHGFLVEGIHFGLGISAAATPWSSGREHKEIMSEMTRTATFIGLLRERSGGQVTLDADGEAQITHALTDPRDEAMHALALGVIARLHEAAGAQRILDLSSGRYSWERGEDLEAFIARMRLLRGGRGGRLLFSAHQMGSARMGSDPQTSVARPSGELHDTRGVWIGDSSAFPSASGANPMLTIMALARRTAQSLLADAPARPRATKATAKSG
jgi:choline dehydrogenase-like flavoprotein